MPSRNAQRLAPRVGVEKRSGAKAKKHVVWRKDRPEPYEEASYRVYIPAVYRRTFLWSQDEMLSSKTGKQKDRVSSDISYK